MTIGLVEFLPMLLTGPVLILLSRRYEAARTAALDEPRSFVGWTLLWAGLAAATLALGVYLLVPAWSAPIALPAAAFAVHAASRSTRARAVLAALLQVTLAGVVLAWSPRLADPREFTRSAARAHARDRAMRDEAEACIAGRVQCDDFTRGYFDRWEAATRGH